jgi:hypothetical protein
MKRLHVFRSGTHRTAGGRELYFSEEDVHTSAAVYDPGVCKAPLVIGHPEGGSAPSFGHAASFSAEEGSEGEAELYCDTARVPQEVVEWAEDGHISGVSASFYAPEQEANPVPGTWYPRHIGLLGQQQPAIKGLDNWPNFEEDEEEAVELVVSFAEGNADFAEASRVADLVGRMMRSMRDFLIDTEGTDTANQVLPPFWIEDLEEEGRGDATDFSEDPSPSSAGDDTDAPTDSPDSTMNPDDENETDPETDADTSSTDDREEALSEREQELAEREAALDEREKTLSEQEAEAQRQEHEDFAEDLIEDGARILPRHKRTVVAVQNALAGGEESVDFSEEGGEDDEVPTLEAFQRFLSELPQNVDFSEVSAPSGDGDDPVDASDAKSIAQAAVDFQEERKEAGETISMSEAVQRVKDERAS